MADHTIHTYKDLIVWQKAIELVVVIYEMTEKFPKEEIYGLTSQMRRCAVSIPSNIAEGRFRGTRKDFLQFLRIAYGSGAELETQITIAKKLQKTKHCEYAEAERLLSEVMRMLNVIINKMLPVRPVAGS
jgi:four helix bundle protein